MYSKLIKSIKSHKILTTIISCVLFVLIAYISVAIPLNMSDGTEKFQGVQKETANQSMQYVNDVMHGIDRIDGPLLVFASAHVSDVRRNTVTADQCRYDSSKINDPSDVYYYETTIELRTLFGIVYKTWVLQGCRDF